LSNATTIDSVLIYIRNKQQQSKKHLAMDSADDGDDNVDDNGDSQLSKEDRQKVFWIAINLILPT
jgi:hypothetical protein